MRLYVHLVADMGPHPYNVDILLTLAMIITAVAISTRWIKVPYSIALVVVGLSIGILKILPPIAMTPDLILVVVLPALLFEAAWNLEMESIKRDWLPISVLATFGVLICMAITAGCLHLVGNVPMGPAFVFGALIASTDAVSVVAVLRGMHLRGRISTLLEGESIFNDGTSIVLFKVVLALVVMGTPLTFKSTVGEFAQVSIGGCFVGLLMGLLASKVTSMFDDHLLEITLTIIVAYGSFLLGEQFHVSPVIAVVTAGIVYGTYGSRVGMSPSTRLAIDQFWQYLAFVVNSLVFLLIGLQVNLDLLAKYKELIGAGIVAVIVARMVTVYGLCPFVSTRRAPIPDNWRHLIVWGGLRGASCMALALSLPLNFQWREGIIVTTFGVVLFSLLFHGLTLGPMIKLLRLLPEEKETAERFRTLRAQLIADREGLELLDELKQSRSVSSKNFQILHKELSDRTASLEQEIQELELEARDLELLELRDTRIRLLESEEDCLRRLSHQGVLSDESFHLLRRDIDMYLEQLHETPLDTIEDSVQIYSRALNEKLKCADYDSDSDVLPEVSLQLVYRDEIDLEGQHNQVVQTETEGSTNKKDETA
ncbi:MAG: Na+/H+ antiporter [Cyanobacteria bacterium]|nr:Na+/H+ antiporter [Cyanobacteriota bacterium]